MLKRLWLLPAILIFPLLLSAQTPVCTSVKAGPLNLNGSASLPEGAVGIEKATFICPGVSIGSGNVNMFDPGNPTPSDNVRWRTRGSGSTLVARIVFSSDPTCIAPNSCESTSSSDGSESIVFFGTFTSGGKTIPIKFTASSDDPAGGIASDTLSISQTPEPGTMLLFGTGMLAAGALLRRRGIHAKLTARS